MNQDKPILRTRENKPFRSRAAQSLLQDIILNIGRVNECVLNIELKTFIEDVLKTYAAVRCLSIISEASRRLPDDIKNRRPEIKRQAIAAAEDYYYTPRTSRVGNQG